MLAQNLKTPADLGLNDVEFDAFIQTLGMLEREEVSFAPKGDYYIRRPTGNAPKFFNMASMKAETDCGTACCILGWAAFIGGFDPKNLVEKLKGSRGLHDLFDPTGTYDPDLITTGQAAVALRNYLTHGEPRWAEAMA